MNKNERWSAYLTYDVDNDKLYEYTEYFFSKYYYLMGNEMNPEYFCN